MRKISVGILDEQVGFASKVVMAEDRQISDFDLNRYRKDSLWTSNTHTESKRLVLSAM